MQTLIIRSSHIDICIYFLVFLVLFFDWLILCFMAYVGISWKRSNFDMALDIRIFGFLDAA